MLLIKKSFHLTHLAQLKLNNVLILHFILISNRWLISFSSSSYFLSSSSFFQFSLRHLVRQRNLIMQEGIPVFLYPFDMTKRLWFSPFSFNNSEHAFRVLDNKWGYFSYLVCELLVEIFDREESIGKWICFVYWFLSYYDEMTCSIYSNYGKGKRNKEYVCNKLYRKF